MVIYSEKAIKFQRMPGDTTKDTGLTLQGEISRAVFARLTLFHQQLGTCFKAVD